MRACSSPEVKDMLFKRLFKRRGKKKEEKKEKTGKEGLNLEKPASITQGLTYMYLVVGLQLLLVFGLIMIFTLIGKVITTPWWVFLLIFIAAVGGCIFIYYWAKKQFKDLRETVKSMNLSDKKFEVSIMGGALTMRIEQNPNRLLEAPPEKPVVDAVIVEHTVTEPQTLRENK